MDKSNLMDVIQMYDFYLNELNLYLDTHPDSKKALELLKKYNELSDAAWQAYNKAFGPVTLRQIKTGDEYKWVQGDWPWERSAN